MASRTAALDMSVTVVIYGHFSMVAHGTAQARLHRADVRMRRDKMAEDQSGLFIKLRYENKLK